MHIKGSPKALSSREIHKKISDGNGLFLSMHGVPAFTSIGRKNRHRIESRKKFTLLDELECYQERIFFCLRTPSFAHVG